MNNLSHAQTERFAKLLEELGEAQQVLGKILLHGVHSRNPHDARACDNITLLHIELGDVLAAIDLLTKKGDLLDHTLIEFAELKSHTITKYMHHQS